VSPRAPLKVAKSRLRRLAIVANGTLTPGTRLGPLESRVLELVWAQEGALSVRQTQGLLPGLAYTTVMTTLDRLFRKQLLGRRRQGRAFVYETRISHDGALCELVSAQIGELLAESNGRSAILSTLVRTVGSTDIALLDQLEALVQAEWKRLKRAEK
jgi:predicted transcriptional regulator